MNQLSRIISGTMTWGVWGKNLSTQAMAEAIEKNVDLGITTFDHADIYGGYTTEAAFGKAFKSCSVSKEKTIHITKCGIQYPCEARPLAVKHYNYTKEHIIASVEKSLKNLQLDTLDVLLLHRPSPLLEVNEVAEAFAFLTKRGDVKSFGVSNFTPQQMAVLKQSATIEWNQLECSLTKNDAMTNGILDYMQAEKIGAMAWSPLGSYFKSVDEKQKRLQPLMQELGEKYSLEEDQLLLTWLLQHPAKIYPVVGTTSSKRIEKAVEATKHTLDIQDWFLLYEASNGHQVA